MSRKDQQVNIRVPDDLMYWVRQAAKENERSITGQIVIAIRRLRQEEERKREKSA